jgi:DNA-binding transcriptional MerR regulator
MVENQREHASMRGVTMREYYSITELTREFGISTRTLRFYEDEGLVQPVRRGRTRLFRPSDRHLIRQILRGKRLGFAISEIREIIQMYKEPPGEVGQLNLMIKRIEEKREELRQKRRDLEDTLAELDQAEESCVERLAELGVNT